MLLVARTFEADELAPVGIQDHGGRSKPPGATDQSKRLQNLLASRIRENRKRKLELGRQHGIDLGLLQSDKCYRHPEFRGIPLSPRKFPELNRAGSTPRIAVDE
jgi:hypothetical protein